MQSDEGIGKRTFNYVLAERLVVEKTHERLDGLFVKLKVLLVLAPRDRLAVKVICHINLFYLILLTVL